MVTQTNHQLTKYAVENKFDTVICLRMGKTYTTKTPPDNFQVTTLEIPLLSQQEVTISPFNARLPST